MFDQTWKHFDAMMDSFSKESDAFWKSTSTMIQEDKASGTLKETHVINLQANTLVDRFRLVWKMLWTGKVTIRYTTRGNYGKGTSTSQ